MNKTYIKLAKIIIIIIFVTFINQYVNSQNKYWNNIPDTEKLNILNNKQIRPMVLNFYHGNVSLLKDDKTQNEILNILTNNRNKKILPLYFYIFNNICLNADAGLSENLGRYCIRMVINNTLYITEYFSLQGEFNNYDLLNTYSLFIADELTSAEGMSKSIYNFTEFKNKILRSNNCSKEQIKVLQLFINKIFDNLNNFDRPQ